MTIYIEDGENQVITIQPDFPIPNGYLINQFIFTDDSQVSTISYKTNN